MEGDNLARERLDAKIAIKQIVALAPWLEENKIAISKHREAEVIIVAPFELEKISSLQTPNQALIVAELPTANRPLPTNEWCIVLDKIQDPGNMGTIIRIADWYGIKHIIASPDSVDFYNPKVVQSAMGGHLRVSLHSTSLIDFIGGTSMPVMAATLDGTSIYQTPKHKAAVLIIGNESKGVSEELLKKVTQKITIPRLGGAESLNAAVATGIICAVCLPQ